MKLFSVTQNLIFLSFILNINSTILLASYKSNDPIEIYFTKDSIKIQSWFFKSSKEESYPVVLLIHGYPDFGKDVLGLGEYLSSEGYNVLCPNYIGTHKSEGIWNPVSSLQSVKAAIDYINSEKFNNQYAVNTKEKIIIGHSFGGGMAFLGSLYDSSIIKVISIAGGDLGVLSNQILSDPEFARSHQQFLDWAISDSTISRGFGGKKTHELYLKILREDFNLKDYCTQFAQKDILLIGGWYDDVIKVESHLIPLFRCLQESGIKRLNINIFETDHSFESVNDNLKKVILNWIKE
jgi:alpha/beta superfamily hydrolase